MSLLRGTLKSKFGFIRSFKDMSLKELDFTCDETDYMLENDLDDIDEGFVPLKEGKAAEPSSKKRVRAKEPEMLEDEKPVFGPSCLDDLDKELDLLELKPSSSSALVQTKAMKVKQEQVKKEQVDSEPVCAEQLPEQPEQKRQPSSSSSSMQLVSSSLDNDEEEEIADSSPTPCFEDEATVEEILEQLESVYLEHRNLVVRSTGFISTPLHALKELALKYDEPIHNEVMYVNMKGFKRPLVHVEIIVGVFRGVGEAFNKRIASQMASLDCLIRLERLGRDDVLVPYAIFPGWRISPRIFEDLLRICKKNGLKAPRYVTKSNLDDPIKPVCKVECYIGQSLVGVGESDMTYVARKLSAYQAIVELTGEKYPLDFVALGSACIPYNELVQTGSVPELSEAKKQWILDASAQESLNLVDPNTLDVLEQEVYQAEMKEIKNERKKFKISIQTEADGENAEKRNVSVK